MRLARDQMSFAFCYKISSTNMESLRELRGMVVFPAEETTGDTLADSLLFR